MFEGRGKVEDILERIKDVKVAVYGDFCIDAYWFIDPRGSEVSVETGLRTQAVRKHYYSLGGASNVVSNLAALEPAGIKVIGVTGNDIFGRELTKQLHALGVDTDCLIEQENDFDTVTFGKPYFEGRERPRIDFGFFNKRSEETDHLLLEGVRNALKHSDVLIFNQQVPGSITNKSFIEETNKLFKEFNDKVVLLDSRHYGHRFTNVYRRTNDLEAAILNGINAEIGEVFKLEDLRQYALNLYSRSHKPVFLTRGWRGIITVDEKGIHEIPGIQVLKKLDAVGAGDTTTSALALCLGAGICPADAAEFANFAAAVTGQKLFQTGTASGSEILQVAEDADYIYQPELACDRRQARYINSSEIELCYTSVPTGSIKHIVFDHDGTISTLRQGWEQIMVPVMIKAILGEQYHAADETLYHKVQNRVLDYVDKSTGIQTILQMEALVEMVREFGIVAEEEILDKFGYKQIYNAALLEMVNKRIKKLRADELDVPNFTIKGALAFLWRLKQKEVKLYLASGTDVDDVVAESGALGYADLFEGRIYGALGDPAKYSKKMVIEKIIRENNLAGAELTVIGDGPVEIQQCRKHNGLAIGIASDEVRRYGLNIHKRERLIKAGAHIIAPDFSQYKQLISTLFRQ
ncbi:MAG: hypothetical protein JXB29_06735 [Sedimentisphaerales bacterium]|nr:hypothetical protein [Sedimentisphaerales bacterium]